MRQMQEEWVKVPDLSSPGQGLREGAGSQAPSQGGADEALQGVRAHAAAAGLRQALGEGRHPARQHHVHQHPQAPHVTCACHMPPSPVLTVHRSICPGKNNSHGQRCSRKVVARHRALIMHAVPMLRPVRRAVQWCHQMPKHQGGQAPAAV